MGKRELLLIAAFVIVGAVVYQATAPPSGPNDRHISLSGIIAKVRREMRGNRANAEQTRVTKHEVDAGLTEIRVTGSFAELTITGEARRDIEVRFHVTSSGYDDAEAKQLATDTRLTIDRAGAALRLESKYPNPGRQRAHLTLLVPAKLNVRVDQGTQRATIANVAALEMVAVRGDTSVKKIAGRATISHRAGRLVVEDVGALKLNGRGSEAGVQNVRGEASFSMQSGELTAESIGGAIDVDAQNAEVTLRKLEEARGTLRVNAVAGSIALEGLAGDARVDGRNTEIEIAMSKPATVAVYNEGGESIEIVVPPGGFTIDALVTDGRLTLPDEVRPHLSTSGGGDDDDREHRATGAVRGGGPTITVRANHGDVTLRTKDSVKADPKPDEKPDENKRELKRRR
jgi:hypothetical protein